MMFLVFWFCFVLKLACCSGVCTHLLRLLRFTHRYFDLRTHLQLECGARLTRQNHEKAAKGRVSRCVAKTDCTESKAMPDGNVFACCCSATARIVSRYLPVPTNGAVRCFGSGGVHAQIAGACKRHSSCFRFTRISSLDVSNGQ